MPPDFLAAIHALRAGESPISPSLARHVLKHYHDLSEIPAGASADEQGGESLTGREVDILQRIATGASVAEIAQQLFISTHTVKTHVKNIYRKLEAHSRIEAVNIAQRRGLIGPGSQRDADSRRCDRRQATVVRVAPAVARPHGVVRAGADA